jgi:hypothetical protein
MERKPITEKDLTPDSIKLLKSMQVNPLQGEYAKAYERNRNNFWIPYSRNIPPLYENSNIFIYNDETSLLEQINYIINDENKKTFKSDDETCDIIILEGYYQDITRIDTKFYLCYYTKKMIIPCTNNDEEENVLEIYNIKIPNELQNRKIGSRTFDILEKYAQKIGQNISVRAIISEVLTNMLEKRGYTFFGAFGTAACKQIIFKGGLNKIKRSYKKSRKIKRSYKKSRKIKKRCCK